MDRLRIGFLTDMCGPVFGGGYQGTLFEIARRFARHHEVRVYTSLPEEVLERERVELRRILPMGIYPDTTGSRGPLQPFVLPWLLRNDPLGGWAPEILLVEAMPFSQLPIMARWMREQPGLKVLNVDEAWVDYSPFPPPFARPSVHLVHWMLSRGLSWSDVAMAVSPATAAALRTAYRAKDVVLAPSGIDVPRLSRQLPPDGSDRTIDVVSVGRLVPMKRQEDLLRALALLKEKHGWKGRAVLLGEGPARSVLRELASRLGLADQVELPGRVEESRKMNVLGTARAFVLPSEREGFSLATLEAMLAGCVPVVAVPPHLEVFGVGGLVVEGKTGFRYPLGDLPALADRLQRVLRAPEQVRAISEEARRVARTYDWDGLADALEAALVSRLRVRA